MKSKTNKRTAKVRADSLQRRVMPTDTQMLNWIGKHVSSIETLKGKGNRVQIEAYYPTDEPELTTGSGKTVVAAFRNAVIKAGWK